MINLTSKLFRELRRFIANRKYEETESGVLIAGSQLLVGGVFDISINGGPVVYGKNTFALEGLDYLLNVGYGGDSQLNPWYVSLFSGNVTPDSSITAATYVSTCTEFTGYAETTRVPYVEAAATGGAMSNTASKATFTINASGTVRGGSLISASAKSSTAGKISAAGRFAADRPVVATDVINVGYALTLTPA